MPLLSAFSLLLKNKKTAYDIIILNGVEIFSMVLPLLLLPILARSLGAAEYGKYVLVQAAATLSSLIIEYGFNLSGTRLLIKSESQSEIQKIASDIFGAKLMLSIVLLMITVIFHLFGLAPSLDHFLTIILLTSLASGWLPMWYFQGTSRLPKYGVIDMSFRFLTVVAMFIFVRHPKDLYLALYINAFGILISSLVNNLIVLKEVGSMKLNVRNSLSALLAARGMAIYRAISYSSGSINTLILGALTSTHAVASYAGADKLATGARFFITPFNQVFFGRVTANRNSLKAAAREFKISLIVLLLTSLPIIAFGSLISQDIVRIFLGNDFGGTERLLKYFLMTTPLYVISATLGLQWMIPMGHDRVYNTLLISSNIIGISTMHVFIQKMGLSGVVASLATGQILFIVSAFIYLAYKKINPILIR
ncbi:oligosaccharide flippase family protein [Deinococcus antarcticus]|uniref:Oligosaccharide flippase family protein n=1 Tax=Deinococcus antarcticus TaxID=1298767 RepID=A0ABV8ADQ0_9DEIO